MDKQDIAINTDQILQSYLIPWGQNILLALAIFIVGRWLAKKITQIMAKLMKRSGMDDMLVNFIQSLLNGLLLLVVIIASLDQLGVDTTSLVALIGAAGLAVGLALQSSLANFASGVMIILFKPFKTGHFIEAGGVSGVVENIQIFNTIILSGDNKVMIVPNGQIYSGTITNYSEKETRRVDLVIGIAYEADLKQAKEILHEILQGDSRILEEPAPGIALGELADCSVNFNVRPWVKSSDYWPVRADILEQVKLRFDEAGIGIPYPQMDIHVSQNT